MGVSTGRGGQMEGREGERTGERLKRGKGGAQRKEKRVKGSGKAGVWACFGAIFGARGGFDGVQLHDAQGWAFKWCINSV